MAEEHLHSDVITGYDLETGRPVVVKAGSSASDLKGLSKEDLQQLRDVGALRTDKYEPVADNSSVGAAATLEEREEGTANRVQTSR